MARSKRLLSRSGAYHVWFRGINKQRIFESKKDYENMISLVHHYSHDYDIELLGFCFMSNHGHLIVKENTDSPCLSRFMALILSGYAAIFNLKYQRCGHLFQDRFGSNPIEDADYFWEALSYVHKNPISAGLVDKLHLYRWSSFQNYHLYQEKAQRFLKLEGSEFKRLFYNAHKIDPDDVKTYLSMPFSGRFRYIHDDEAAHIICSVSEVSRPEDIQAMSFEERIKLYPKMTQHGLPEKQIARLTGISKWKRRH